MKIKIILHRTKPAKVIFGIVENKQKHNKRKSQEKHNKKSQLLVSLKPAT